MLILPGHYDNTYDDFTYNDFTYKDFTYNDNTDLNMGKIPYNGINYN